MRRIDRILLTAAIAIVCWVVIHFDVASANSILHVDPRAKLVVDAVRIELVAR